MVTRYSTKTIEKKWQDRWEKEKAGQASDESNKEKCYVLDMFPYPSGDGLHVGHVENYTATDIYARYKRLKGFEVMHPIGWDAFGLPAENFAIKTGVHPDEKTHQNIANFTKQIKSLGISYDWSREIDTSSPEYYKWTQWLFLFLYKNGLAYRKQASVNWCPSCQTVLANEQVVDGVCERCKTEVVQKDLKQWFFKITDFIEDQEFEGRNVAGLISGLEKIDWPESTKKAQQHWIGRSEGMLFTAPVKDMDLKIQTFSAHFEAFAADTFVVIASDHKLLPQLLEGVENKEEILAFCKRLTDIRMSQEYGAEQEMEGIFTGRYIIDPVGNGELPIWVASYALADYGTGIVKCSAHDERDFAFAKKYNIPLKTVLFPEDLDEKKKVADFEMCYVDMKNGVLSEPEVFSGKKGRDSREDIVKYLEENNIAVKKTSYKLRDWLVSRQRYWGAPIPIIYCEICGEQPVPEADLPVKLPTDVDFRPTGESPLTRSESFHDVKCPKCGEKARRESDTMDTFVCSSWYYLRFADPKNKDVFADPEKLAKWLPVDVYMGGAEHTVLHLLYARFFTKVLKKYGLVNFDEPFMKLKHQGMVLAEDGRKMSKSLGNVVNPDDIVNQFGADSLRLYEMFMGPLEDSKAWKTDNLVGPRRFLEKIWRMGQKVSVEHEDAEISGAGVFLEAEDGKFLFHVRDNHTDIAPESIAFFGGRRESGESPEMCAVRELQEELDMRIESKDLKHITDLSSPRTGYWDRFFITSVPKVVGKEDIEWKTNEGDGIIFLTIDEALEKENLDTRTRSICEMIKQQGSVVSLLHKTIKKIGQDIEDFHFNTCISGLMVLANEMDKQKTIAKKDFKMLLLLLSPFAPHIAEELWEMIGHADSLFLAAWPEHEEKYLQEKSVEIVVQVNGKLRAKLSVPSDSEQKDVEALVMEDKKIAEYTQGKTIRKVIFVPNRLMNIVVG